VVADPYRVVDMVVRNNQTIGAGGNIQIVSVTTALLTSVKVVLAGTNTQLNDYAIQVINNNTIILTFTTSPVGTVVDVILALGNQIMVQGEQIKFTSINMTTGEIMGLDRGVNGTIVNPVLYEGSQVVAVLNSEQLNQIYYDITWYEHYTGADINYPTNTIPLQLTSTQPADFLTTVV
jgi:hypothetical protein